MKLSSSQAEFYNDIVNFLFEIFDCRTYFIDLNMIGMPFVFLLLGMRTSDMSGDTSPVNNTFTIFALILVSNIYFWISVQVCMKFLLAIIKFWLVVD